MGAFVFQVFLPLGVGTIHELVDEFDPVSTLDARGDKAVLEVLFEKQLWNLSARC